MELAYFYWYGFAATTILLVGVLASIQDFSGMKQEPFSFLNHFISELGDPRFAQHYRLFAVTLISSGVLMLPFVIGLAGIFHSLAALLALIVGIICSVACSLIGLFPEDKVKAHFAISGVFFVGMGVLMVLFTVAIVLEPAVGFPSWFLAVTVVLFLFFVSFVIDTARLSEAELRRTDEPWNWEEGRPKFWLNPFLEWVALFSVIIWLYFVIYISLTIS